VTAEIADSRHFCHSEQAPWYSQIRQNQYGLLNLLKCGPAAFRYDDGEVARLP
jgi:hypothetical protein